MRAQSLHQIDENEKMPSCGFALSVTSPHEAEHVIGDMRARRPDLGAVDHIIVAVADGADVLRLARSGARSPARVALTENDVARHRCAAGT